MKKETQYGFSNFNTFDHDEYEHYEKTKCEDLNWIIPDSFIGFCGHHARSRPENYYHKNPPEPYITYFKTHIVTT